MKFKRGDIIKIVKIVDDEGFVWKPYIDHIGEKAEYIQHQEGGSHIKFQFGKDLEPSDAFLPDECMELVLPEPDDSPTYEDGVVHGRNQMLFICKTRLDELKTLFTKLNPNLYLHDHIVMMKQFDKLLSEPTAEELTIQPAQKEKL